MDSNCRRDRLKFPYISDALGDMRPTGTFCNRLPSRVLSVTARSQSRSTYATHFYEQHTLAHSILRAQRPLLNGCATRFPEPACE